MPETGARILLRDAASGTDVAFAPARLVIAGYTGASQERTLRHIDELASHGVPAPPSVPMFYDIAVSLLSFGEEIAVDSNQTSGEVEPVLYCMAQGWYLGVGSDHTARDVERESVERSKKACPKVASQQVIPYDTVARRWERLRLRSFTGTNEDPYQDAYASDILPVEKIVTAYRERGGMTAEGLVMFLGTVPLSRGAFVYADTFTGELTDPDLDLRLTCHYRVSRRR